MPATRDDYLNGKEAYRNPAMREAVEAHYRGEIKLKRSEDWFYGFQDAADDARWEDPQFLAGLAKRESDFYDMF